MKTRDVLMGKGESGSGKKNRVRRGMRRHPIHGAAKMLLLVIGAVVGTAAGQESFWVDPKSGHDGNPGSQAKPFATLNRARAAVRPLTVAMKGDITVTLRGGVYPVAPTVKKIPLMDTWQNRVVGTWDFREGDLRFGTEDGGRGGHSVVWRAAQGETAVISGGHRVTGWTLHDRSRNLWKAALPAGMETRHFWVDGRRCQRARGPDRALRFLSFDPRALSNGGPSHVLQGTKLADYRNLQDVEFVFKEIWTLPRVGVDRVERDGDRLKIWLKQPGWQYLANRGGTSAKTPLWVENAMELLDEPGEWYLDRPASTLYYMAQAGENPAAAECVVPVVDELVSVKGASLDAPVSNLRFEGITFRYSGFLRPNGVNGHSDAQDNYIREPAGKGNNDWTPPAAVSVRRARGVVFERCTFDHLGINALEIMEGSQDNLVRGCRFLDISGGGIQVGDPQWRLAEDRKNFAPEDPRLLLRNNDVVSCYFKGVAAEFLSATAISATYTVDMDVLHNEVVDVPYSGMHFGYSWAELETTCTRGLRVAHNLVDGFMQVLEDGGGLYFNGATGGTAAQPNVVASNVVRRQGNPYYGSIYFDNGCARYGAVDNVFEKIQSIYLVNKDNRLIDLGRHWSKGGESRILRVDPAAFQIRTRDAIRVEGPQWPPEAEGVVDRAGLLPAYRDLRPDFAAAAEIACDDWIDLKVGESRPLGARVRSRRGHLLEAGSLAYVNNGPAVVSVDPLGNLKALSAGRAVVRVLAGKGPGAMERQVVVAVDDRVEVLDSGMEHGRVKAGSMVRLDPRLLTRFGATRAAPGARVEVLTPDLASLSSNGLIQGLKVGTARIRVTAAVDGKTLGSEFRLEVVDRPADHLLSDWPYWHVAGTGRKTPLSNGMALSTPNGYALYQGKAFGDEMLEFDLTIEASPGYWRALCLRAEKPDAYVMGPESAGYVVIFKEEEIELQRFTRGKRRWLLGGQSGDPAKFLRNEVVQHGTSHRVRLQAMDEAGGVRLSLWVDGKPVFQVLDSDAEALRGRGFFGVVERNGTMKLTGVSPGNGGRVWLENFDSGTPNLLRPAMVSAESNGIASQVLDLPAGGKALEIVKQAVTKQSPIWSSPKFPWEGKGKMWARARILAGQDSAIGTLLLQAPGGVNNVYLNLGVQDAYVVTEKGAKTLSTGSRLGVNQWMEILVRLDLDAGRADVLFDGREVLKQIPWWAPSESKAAQIQFMFHRESVGRFILDDLEIGKGDGPGR